MNRVNTNKSLKAQLGRCELFCIEELSRIFRNKDNFQQRPGLKWKRFQWKPIISGSQTSSQVFSGNSRSPVTVWLRYFRFRASDNYRFENVQFERNFAVLTDFDGSTPKKFWIEFAGCNRWCFDNSLASTGGAVDNKLLMSSDSL